MKPGNHSTIDLLQYNNSALKLEILKGWRYVWRYIDFYKKKASFGGIIVISPICNYYSDSKTLWVYCKAVCSMYAIHVWIFDNLTKSRQAKKLTIEEI